MTSVFKLPAIAGSLSIAAALIGASLHPAVKEFLVRHLGDSAMPNMIKALVAGIAILNFKNIPGIWHLRVLRGVFYHLRYQKHTLPAKHLFAPLITSSSNSLYDCDYNIHKSNSTYFADLDVARAHLISAVIRVSLDRLTRGDLEGLPQEALDAKGDWNPALGAVSCFFQREIKPLEAYDIYTRVLSWDRKWIYTISHIVKKGAIKPDSYVLQPWKKVKPERATKEGEDLTKHIFATSIARYVFKKGRLTVNPEIVLNRSRLLPPRPPGVSMPPRAAEESITGTPATPATPAESTTSPESIAGALNSKLGSVAYAKATTEDDDWTWDDMERERLRGLRLANHFDALAASHKELKGGAAMGQFNDYW